ncbi:hypothetical protein K458DRAFT_396198 [Lentithecium fluviatile CBS 122367]|uniref:DUF7918 domain-containing protein n=1 Tax=Lentithecium fluviatile CBS 122367 TaxID=1168545 RepID=A0A6G1IGP7_9PLEO|nr:hypothetical protein K458DRAFT_396198 [Lentithecium fluviatile CBS 122367]
MAIATGDSSLEATVEVGGLPLAEYDGALPEPNSASPSPPASSSTQPITKYIEAPDGAVFTIRGLFKPHFRSYT